MPDDAPWAAYARTILLIGDAPRIKVDLSRPLSDDLLHLLTKLGLGTTFAIVTPFDPYGKRAFAWRNVLRFFSMRRRLRSRNLRFVAADGESPDSSHRERGFAIAMTQSDARVLAREYNQLALYWFDGEAFWIDGVLDPRPPQRLP